MILAMNIGNTHFAMSLKKDIHEAGGIYSVVRHPSAVFMAKQDFIEVMSSFVTVPPDGFIFSSVNPCLTKFLESAVKEYYGRSPLIVDAYMNMKLDLSLYDKNLIGSDRIVLCEAAVSRCTLPAIIFDFGTATTINVVDGNGRFLGGSILPGVRMGLEALSKNTAQLPQGEISSHAGLIGQNTHQCLASGAIFGNASMLDGMVDRIESFLGRKANILVTGGNSEAILPYCHTETVHVADLIIEGLFILYAENYNNYGQKQFNYR